MKLKPFIENEDELEDPIQKSINEALSITGIKKGKSAKLELEEIREIFNNAGAGIEDVASTVSGVMRSSDKEELRLRAADIALKVQGVFKELDGNIIPSIVINVQGEGNQTLINLVCPA